jgi:peptidyl-prolyl cis-trans isomerase A (cyclophilin A)
MRSVRRFFVGPLVLIAVAAPQAWGQGNLSAALKAKLKDPADPVVRLSTSMGDITLDLYKKDAPKTVDNFVAYVQKKHYDGTVFHRVMDGFMIQGGGMDKDMKEKATMAPIVNESKLSNTRGTIAMARTSDPNSATSQFFINVADNSNGLDKGKRDPNGYAVFGTVIAGMDVVDKIKAVKVTTKAGHENVPITPVVIKSATVLK